MQRDLTTWSKTAAAVVLGAAVMLIDAHYATAAPQTAPAAQTAPAKKAKAVKDTAEYDIYNDVIKDATSRDYKKLVTDLDTWTQKYPNTDYKDERSAYYIQGYGGSGQSTKALDVAKGLFVGGMAGIKEALGSSSLILPTVVLAVASATQAATAGDPTPDELDTGEKAAKLLLDYAKELFVPANKPANLTDAQWSQGLKQVQETANTALLQIELYPATSILRPNAKDPALCAKAEPAFIKALQDYPDSGQIALQLANNYFCQRATPEKLLDSLYEYARAVGEPLGPPFGLDAANQKTFSDFLKSTYIRLHGSDEGLAELMEQAKNSPFPPTGFKIKTAGEIALEKQEQFAKENPQLAMWMGIEGNLSGDGGQAYFDNTLKDADVKGQNGTRALKGTVVAAKKEVNKKEVTATCDPTILLVAIPLPGQTGDAANMAKVKLHLLNGTIKGKVADGAVVQWDGVPMVFSKDPFLLTMDLDDATKLDVTTEKCPVTPVRKGPAPAPKKKGGE